MKPDFVYDVLFVHVPKFSNEYLPLGEFMNITYMPMGIFAMANKLNASGYRCKIVHLGLEWIQDKNFDLLDYIAQFPARAIGFTLYWHYQTYDALFTATQVKKRFPESMVFMGGLTASYFSDQIIENFPQVDAVLKGHAESTILDLAGELNTQEPKLENIRNLVFRKNGRPHMGKPLYVACPADLNGLVFADLSELKNWPVYVQSFGFPLAYSKEYKKDENKTHQTMGRTFFPLFTGRGCPTSCAYCGGSCKTLAKANGTSGVIWRDHLEVINDIRLALEAGYKTMSLCFDPYPNAPEYYVRLFELIRREKIEADWYFENWGLPTNEFLESFAQTFSAPHSYLALSPDSGNEQVRNMNKGYSYTNAQLYQTLDFAQKKGVRIDVFFTLALAGETAKTAMDTKEMIDHIRGRYDNIGRLMTWSVQLEPGSPQFENPEKYNMVSDRKNLMDFYHAHKGIRADTYSSLGFKINGYFGDERDNGTIADFERHLQHFKCMEFCFLSPDPRQHYTPQQSRQHCLERREKIALRRGIKKEQKIIQDGYDYFDALKDIHEDGYGHETKRTSFVREVLT